MPKDCSSEYVIITSGDCDSSISSYIVATDNSCDDSTYDLVRCESGCDSSSCHNCGSSSSDCGCSSSGCSSSSSSRCDSCGSSSGYCKCSNSDCSSSYYDSCSSGRYYRHCKTPCYQEPPVIQRNTIITTLPARSSDDGTSDIMNQASTPAESALPPNTVQHPRNRSFRSVVTPLAGLTTPFSTDGGPNGVAFTMRKRNDVVTLQNEPFSGVLGAKGANHLSMTQSLADLPPHPVDIPHRYTLNGVGRMGFIRITPLDASSNLKFFFDTDPTFTTDIGDTVEIPGNSISWVTGY